MAATHRLFVAHLLQGIAHQIEEYLISPQIAEVWAHLAQTPRPLLDEATLAAAPQNRAGLQIVTGGALCPRLEPLGDSSPRSAASA